jgi:hypothetical protein
MLDAGGDGGAPGLPSNMCGGQLRWVSVADREESCQLVVVSAGGGFVVVS